MTSEIVSQKEICDRLGFSRQWFQILSKRPDYPRPLGAPGNRRVWDWADIKAWHDAHPRR